jgi:vacuolar-type H+-ATPase subunit H
MATQELNDLSRRRATARKLCDDASERAKMASIEAEKQAKIVYDSAIKLAVDDQARKETTKAYEEAVKHAEEIRHKIEWEAQVVFTHTWVQSDKDYQEALIKSKERMASAKKTYDEVKNRASIVFEEAKKSADGKQAKEVAKVYKKTIEQAEKDYHKAITNPQ